MGRTIVVFGYVLRRQGLSELYTVMGADNMDVSAQHDVLLDSWLGTTDKYLKMHDYSYVFNGAALDLTEAQVLPFLNGDPLKQCYASIANDTSRIACVYCRWGFPILHSNRLQWGSCASVTYPLRNFSELLPLNGGDPDSVPQTHFRIATPHCGSR